MKSANNRESVLRVEDIRVRFPITSGSLFRRKIGEIRAVDGASLEIRSGEVLGLVGESGSGKTTLSRLIMRLLIPDSGKVLLDGRDLGAMRHAAFRRERANFQMIFQDPFASLNPRMTVFSALAEAVRIRHPKLRGPAMRAHVAGLMEKVGLSPRLMRKYPHEFSGGQRQRIAIARALAPEPRLIVADEPVSALDVSIQSQILNLLSKLVSEADLAMLFISHDLGVVKYIADQVAVMYMGKIIEVGDAEAVISRPLHPYTKALVSAIPIPDPRLERTRRRIILQGDPPIAAAIPEGCAFHPRCPYARLECKLMVPALLQYENRDVACIRVAAIHSK